MRNYWLLGPEPFAAAHFAVFPTELARRCIAAGTSERGCCSECGAPWRRVVNRASDNRSNAVLASTPIAGKGHVSSQVREDHDVRNGPTAMVRTIGWEPTCGHGREPVPSTVLDPFAGSGTTLAVARAMGRRAVGVELQKAYLPLIQARVAEAAQPLLEHERHGPEQAGVEMLRLFDESA